MACDGGGDAEAARMTDIQDLCDRCARHKAHFEVELIENLAPGTKLEVDDLPFPRAGYLCRSCAVLLQTTFPNFYALTELSDL